jgi:hypothetical protein
MRFRTNIVLFQEEMWIRDIEQVELHHATLYYSE